jgi:hypothetical protein
LSNWSVKTGSLYYKSDPISPQLALQHIEELEKKLDVFNLIDYCADHIENFGAWPAEYETASGKVWTMAQYTQYLENTAPAVWRMLNTNFLAL